MLTNDKRRALIALAVLGAAVVGVISLQAVFEDDDAPTAGAAVAGEPIERDSDISPQPSTSRGDADSPYSELGFDQVRNPFAVPVDPSRIGSGSTSSSSYIPWDPTSSSSAFPDFESTSSTSFPTFTPDPVTTISYLEYVGGPPESARLKVGDELVIAVPGDVIAGRFILVSLEGVCANMRSGDLPFRICVGEAILK